MIWFAGLAYLFGEIGERLLLVNFIVHYIFLPHHCFIFSQLYCFQLLLYGTVALTLYSVGEDAKKGVDVVQSPGVGREQSDTDRSAEAASKRRRYDICLIYRHGDKDWVKTNLQKHFQELELSIYEVPSPQQIEHLKLTDEFSENVKQCSVCLFICSPDSIHPEGDYTFKDLLDYTLAKAFKDRSTAKLIIISTDRETSFLEASVDPITFLDWVDLEQQTVIIELIWSVSARGLSNEKSRELAYQICGETNLEYSFD